MATPKVSLRSNKPSAGPAVYYLDYRINGKRIRSKVGTDKKKAELIRAKTEQDILLGKYDLNSSIKVISLHGLIEEFLDSKKHAVRATSFHRYKNYLDPLSRYFNRAFPAVTGDIRLIDVKYLRKFIDDSLEGSASRGKKWSKRTSNDAIKIVRSLFKFAIESGYLTRNPASRLQTLRIASSGRADFFSDKELEAIWARIKPHWVDPLKFITHTGLRKAELINLQWDSVDLTKGSEQVAVESHDEWETKTGNVRIVPLNSEAVEILKRQGNKHPHFVFTSVEGKQIHPDKIYRALKKCLMELGIEGDVHKLRHTFASKLAMSNVDLFTIKDLLGHTDLKTTQIYAHVSPRHIRDAVHKLSFSQSEKLEGPGVAEELPPG